MLEEASAAKIRLIMTLRNAGIADTDVLAAIESIPREPFCAADCGNPYADVGYVSPGQYILHPPSVLAFMLVALRPSDRLRVLDVGTGTGYQAAVLSQLSRMVYSLDVSLEAQAPAKERLKDLGFTNLILLQGATDKGWAKSAPFDRIFVNTLHGGIPAKLIDQLAVGGIMVVPVGQSPSESMILRVVKTEHGIETQQLIHSPLRGRYIYPAETGAL